MTDSNVVINAVFHAKPGFWDPETQNVLLDNNGSEGSMGNNNALLITKIGDNRQLTIPTVYSLDGSVSSYAFIEFTPGILQDGDTIYLNNARDNGGCRASVFPNSPIDKNVTVIDSYATVYSMVSLMTYWTYSNSAYQSNFKITNPNGDFTYNYSKDDGSWTYVVKDDQGNSRTFKCEGTSNVNDVYFVKFSDPGASPANIIYYYVYDTDQSFFPHTN